MALAALAGGTAGGAAGEQHQQGNLIVSLDGGLSPLRLPRDRAAPVSVHVEGGLRTDDGALLPRVIGIELALPGRGILDTRGLPVCSPRRLRFTTTAEAREACGPALVGRGRLRADVVLPNQAPVAIDGHLLAFNARVHGRTAVVLHAFARRAPGTVVLTFLVGREQGRLGTTLAAKLPRALGPWPRFAHFEMTLGRRFVYRGRRHSYLNASCPLPRALTAGFFSLARARFVLLGGRHIGTEIIRGCRAR
ncbi:MAG TPA: hypothetical protein VHA54_11650 [Solirubrobacterales bacterium]|nr:hypothetical protein [Solirubrobacterales bacterium]